MNAIRHLAIRTGRTYTLVLVDEDANQTHSDGRSCLVLEAGRTQGGFPMAIAMFEVGVDNAEVEAALASYRAGEPADIEFEPSSGCALRWHALGREVSLTYSEFAAVQAFSVQHQGDMVLGRESGSIRVPAAVVKAVASQAARAA
jgi:hypothetical protein